MSDGVPNSLNETYGTYGTHTSCLPSLQQLTMRIAVGQFNELTDEQLSFARQVGAKDILLNTPKLHGDERWELEDLQSWRQRSEDHGLRLICLENVPVKFYDKIMLGFPGRDEQMENMAATVRNMGRAGIPILGYHWMPNGVWRTSFETATRGGAISNEFDFELVKNAPLTHDRTYEAEEMWANYDWYLDRLVPVAEEAGVLLALHPDDPPVPTLGGVARLFCNFEGFRRAMERHPSPNHGLDFCHGCWSEMRGGAGVLDAVEYFGSRGRIFYVHMRDVQGDANDFKECFIDEGNCRPFETICRLRDLGFKGFIIDDHVPRLVNDSPWGHRGRAFATGYLAGLLDAAGVLRIGA